MTAVNPAPTGIHLTTGYFWLAFLLAFFKPEVSIDGGPPVQVHWGDAFLPTAPGAHRVNVWFNYLFFGACGKAELVVDVPASGAVPLDYKAPTWFVFSPGKLVVGGAAPGALPGASAPGVAGVAQTAAQAAQPAAAPAAAAPQWDASRNAYVQYDVARQCWLQFDDATQQWRPIT